MNHAIRNFIQESIELAETDDDLNLTEPLLGFPVGTPLEKLKALVEQLEILNAWQFSDPAVFQWLTCAPVNMESAYDKWEPKVTDAKDMQKRLEDLAITAACAAEYIGTRAGTDGTGKHDHKDATKATNKVYKAIRKAFGFTVNYGWFS